MTRPIRFPGAVVLFGLLGAVSFHTQALAQSAPQQGADERIREAQPSQSVRDVLREEHALFSDRFTIEPGISYSYSDRSQMMLDGWLFEHAIFLGDISVDSVKSHTTTFDLSLRYGFTNRLEAQLNIPYVYRSSTFETQGSAGNRQSGSQNGGDLGDIQGDLYYRLLPGTESRPDVVWSLGFRAPTGKHPYGINTRNAGENLYVPDELPTGNGVWGVSTGFSVLKTLDPAIVFANFGYTYNFDKSFSDVGNNPDTKNPGEVSLGDSIRFGFGTAFALNPRFSLSFSYTHQQTFETSVKLDGSAREDLGEATAGAFNIGATYAMSDTMSLVTNLGIGVTDDAPDITLTFRLPFQM